ncbi:MAG: class I SAM-dependent methyltransferase [Anaerolineales bacterium]|nr:class I SAM-dependent methyltransferase [Anaerolineales bacterium]
MFDVITRKEYWDWLNELEPEAKYRGFLRRTRRNLALRRYGFGMGDEHTLKTIQDAYVYTRLRKEKGKKILEAGGGNSRVLRLLRKANECWLVDKFEGMGNGPLRRPFLGGVKIVEDYLGEFNPILRAGYFDTLFSISVVEHIPLDYLDAFFRDCVRVLKPGGRMIHAIDTYIYDPADRQNPELQEMMERTKCYLAYADRPDLGIRLVRPPQVDANLVFSCRYASQPDNVLYKWQQGFATIKREIAQMVSFKAEWIKV